MKLLAVKGNNRMQALSIALSQRLCGYLSYHLNAWVVLDSLQSRSLHHRYAIQHSYFVPLAVNMCAVQGLSSWFK